MATPQPPSSVDSETALALHRQGRLQEAIVAYERVLAKTPRDAQALGASGLALHQLGLHDAAAMRLQAALHVDPTRGETWSYLALAFEAQGRLADALAALQQAVQREPDTPALWNNLSAIYIALGRASEAETASRRATALAPDDAAGWFNLAISQQAAGNLVVALQSSSRAVELAPEGVAQAGLKAQIEADLGHLEAARATVSAALRRHHNVAALHLQAAEIAVRCNDMVGAVQSYANALTLEPNNGAILSELIFLQKRQANWKGLGLLRQRFRAGVVAGNAALTPFSFLSDPSTRAEQRRCAERWSASFTQAAPAAPPRRLSPGALRVGYLSADFHQHATAILAAGLFEAHDRSRFVINGYSTGPHDGSSMRSRLQDAFMHFVDARDWSATQLADRMRSDGIDILVDLKGHTANARTDVLALRPAPIQVSYLGYPGTVGAPFIDYLIGDPIVTPFEHAADYSETLVLLPESYQINDAARPIAGAPSRLSLHLPDSGVVFCCFNAAFKFNPEVFDAWAQILKATPVSVLWLLATAGDPANDRCADNLRREMAGRGVDPARLIFAQRRPYAEYLGLYRRADLFLDTWPYNAHTTASDALWAGCPVLTSIGDTFAGRVAASLLVATGLPDLVAPSIGRYIEQAIALAADRPALARYRAYLEDAGRRSPLFDTVATTRALEAAYLEMAAQYRRGVRLPIWLSAAPQ